MPCRAGRSLLIGQGSGGGSGSAGQRSTWAYICWARANTSRDPNRVRAARSPMPSNSSALAISSGSTADRQTSPNSSQSAATVVGAEPFSLAPVSGGRRGARSAVCGS